MSGVDPAGRVALVTGANRGFGHAVARGLLERGAATVYAGVRDPASVTDPDVVPIRLDITDDAQVDEATRQCADVSILVNNAGIAHRTPLLGAPTLDDAHADMAVNYFVTLPMCRAFAPMLRERGGALANVLSIASFMAPPMVGTYAASKSAAWSLTNSVRVELAESGVLVTSLHVGHMDTDLVADVNVPKQDPARVASQLLDALAAGQEEVLADEQTRQVKAALPHDLDLTYPRIRTLWTAILGGARY